MLTVNALAAADTTLIPVQAQYLSAKGLEQLLQTIQKVRRQINPKLKIEGILMTMTDSRTNYGREIDALIRQVYGSKIRVFEQPIPHSVRAAEISAEGRSIFDHDPKGKVAAAYQKFNCAQPMDYHGHSLSVSDVILLNQAGKISAHYVDSIGFRELSGFQDKQERSSVLSQLKTKCDMPECNPTKCRKERDDHAI